MRALVVLAALSTSGCFAPIDLANRQCPCTTGWTCVDGACVQGESRDGGVVDTGHDAASAESDGGLLTVCPVGAFCEDFEGSSPESNGWAVAPDYSRVTFIDARNPDPAVTAHRGTGMVRITTVTPAGQSDISICPFEGFTCPTDLPDGGVPPGITSGDIYLRAYLYVPSTLADGSPLTMGHASVLYVGAHRGAWLAGEAVTSFNLDVDRASMYLGTIAERVEPRPAPGDTDTRPPFPRDTWTCVRVHLFVDPSNGVAESFLGSDAVPEVSRTAIGTVSSLPYLHFGVGLAYTDEMPNGATIYADDVAFGTVPLPCFE